MGTEWARLCRSDNLAIDGDSIEVTLAEGRHQRVSVNDAGATFELQSVVARAALVRDLEEVPLLAWTRNRSSHLVGFRVDQRGRLVGESWIPKIGLTAEEFQVYVRRIAAECDRFEYQLTGADTE